MLSNPQMQPTSAKRCNSYIGSPPVAREGTWVFAGRLQLICISLDSATEHLKRAGGAMPRANRGGWKTCSRGHKYRGPGGCPT